MAGARVPWWGHVVKKIMQPDRPFILVPHVGITTWEEGPPISGTCTAGSKDPTATKHGTFQRSQKRKGLQRRRQAEGIC